MALGATSLSGLPIILSREEQVSRLRRSMTTSANDNVQLALIGAGGMGSVDVQTALRIPGVKIVAVCDLYKGNLKKAKETYGSDIFTTKTIVKYCPVMMLTQ